MQRHPLSAVWPDLNLTDHAALEKSIAERGVLFPITIHEGQVLDGWHRHQIATKLGLECPAEELPEGEDPTAFVLAQNQHRRHMKPGQWAAVLAQLEALPQGRPRRDRSHATAEELAEENPVSRRTIQTVRAIQRDAPDLVEPIKEGLISPHDAAQIADQEPAVREEAVARVRRGENKTAAHALTQQQRDQVKQQPPPEGRYHTVVCEPLWTQGNVQDLRLPCDRRCILWLHTPNRYILEGLQAIRIWGFERMAVLTWCHNALSHDQHNLVQRDSDFIILARRGDIPLMDTRDFFTWFKSDNFATPLPPAFFKLVERCSPPPWAYRRILYRHPTEERWPLKSE